MESKMIIPKDFVVSPFDFFIGDIVLHVKSGKEYKIVSFPRHSETLEPMVCYVDNDGNSWVRPGFMFFDGRFKKGEHF